VGVVAPYRTLEEIGDVARPYPTQYLEDLDHGLCLFGAGFLGHNDAIHFAEHGLETTVVDVDEERLAEMRALYPEEWEFVCADAWAYAEAAADAGVVFDAVSVDVYTGDAELRALQELELWTSLASRLVTVTATPDKRFDTPAGWRVSTHERVAGVYWLCLRRDA
jgi:hypothetical protein